MTKLKRAHTQSWATGVVVAFLIIAAVVGLSIAYFSFAKTTITITPEPQEFSATLEVALNQIDGSLVATEKQGTLDYTELSADKEEPDFAQGTVRLENETNADQPLVATTRLLSDGGILFRTQEFVTVPANGQITVLVKADQVGSEGNIGPSKFEIVALHQSQKSKIYGESSASMTGGVKKIGVLTLADIEKAKDILEEDLTTSAVSDLITQLRVAGKPTDHITPDTVIVERLEDSHSAQVGDTVNLLTVSLKLKVTAVSFDPNPLKNWVSEQAEGQTPEGTRVVDLEGYQNFSYALPDQPTPPDQPQKINVTVTGSTILKLSSPLLDRSKIVNKDEQDIKIYFSNFEEVKDVQVIFRPFWIKRAPALEDHILIQIAEPSSSNTNL